jgi:cytoskeletal protein RodZ
MAAEDGGAPIPELVQLGEKLSQARREQGLTLEDLAGRLRLGTEQLMALEAGDHTHLPEAVFVVAQAKRVAGALQIDVSQQISDLQDSRMMRQPRQPAGGAGQRRIPAASPHQPRPRSTSRPVGPIGWLLLLFLGGGVLAVAALLGRLPSLTTGGRAPAPAAAPRPAGSPPNSPAPAALAKPDQLLLRSVELSWLEVRDGNGVTLFRGFLRGEKRFPLGNGLKVLAGRPDLVTVAAGTQSPSALGRIDQVVWRTFRPTPGAP